MSNPQPICKCCGKPFLRRSSDDPNCCRTCSLLEGFSAGNSTGTDANAKECCPPNPDFLARRVTGDSRAPSDVTMAATPTEGTAPKLVTGKCGQTMSNSEETGDSRERPAIAFAPSASETGVTSKSDSSSAHDPSFALAEGASRCEIREGIGLCDDCCLPKWPQNSVGYGFMLCLDCIAKQKRELDNHVELFRAAAAVHKRMDQRTRQRARGGRHFMKEAQKAALCFGGIPRNEGPPGGASDGQGQPDEVGAPGCHELTTPAHTWEHLLKLWEASYQLGLDALLERRQEQSRFYLVCSDADWASVQMRAMR